MPRKCYKQQFRLFCEFKKLFPNHQIKYDEKIILINSNKEKQQVEVDISIIDLFDKDVNLYIENDGYLWHKNKRDKDYEKSQIIIANGHHIIRTIDKRLESLKTEYEIFYDQNKDFLPTILEVCNTLISILKKYNNTKNIKIIQNYINQNIYINDEEFYDYYNKNIIPNSLLEIYPEHSKEYSSFNKLKPYSINCGSMTKYYWLCNICSYLYSKTVSEKLKIGCPNCKATIKQKKSYEKLEKIFNKIDNEQELTRSEKQFLEDKRQARLCRKDSCAFYLSDLTLAKSYKNINIINIFDIYNPESESNKTCRKYCTFFKNNDGIHASAQSKDEYEKSLAIWRYRKLSILRHVEEENSIGVFYDSDFKIAKQEGCEFIFDLSESPEMQQNKAAIEIINWSKSNDHRRPNSNSNDPTEAKLARKIGTLMRNINEIQSAGGEFYESTKQLFIQAGLYNDFFTPTKNRLEINSNSKTIQLIKFIKNHNRLPKQNKTNMTEYELAGWLNKKRQINSGKIKGNFYLSDLKIAKENNFPLLFEQGYVYNFRPEK